MPFKSLFPGLFERRVVKNGKKIRENRLADFLGEGLPFFLILLPVAFDAMAEISWKKTPAARPLRIAGGITNQSGVPLARGTHGGFGMPIKLSHSPDRDGEWRVSLDDTTIVCFQGLPRGSGPFGAVRTG